MAWRSKKFIGFYTFFCAENSFFIAAKDKTPIKVTLRDGKVVDGQAWKTTPYDIASSIRYGLDLSKPVQSFDYPEIHVWRPTQVANIEVELLQLIDCEWPFFQLENVKSTVLRKL